MLKASKLWSLRDQEAINSTKLFSRALLLLYGMAFVFGAGLSFALPPHYLFPFAIVAFSGAIWLLHRAPGWKQAFFCGLAFGFGFFLLGLHWIATAVEVYNPAAGLLSYGAPGVLSLYLALYPALAFAFTKLLSSSGVSRVFLFAALWTLAEIFRGQFFTGFPWNPLGSIWGFSLPLLQSVSLFGVFGLSLFTLLFCALPGLLMLSPTKSATRHILGLFALMILLLSGFYVYGASRLGENLRADVPHVRLRLVQANIAQRDKWQRALYAQHLYTYLKLSQWEGYEKITHLIWPETALPENPEDSPTNRWLISRLLSEGGVSGETYNLEGTEDRTGNRAEGRLLITGAASLDRGTLPYRLYNSLIALDAAGETMGVYHKSHLVPYGEYLPFRPFLGRIGFDKLVAGFTDYTPGPGRKTLSLPGLPAFSPLICYEIIFPGEVLGREGDPHWILNLTNDAWYGMSAGPYQHFVAAQMRAIEEGLPVIRSTGTGISAIMDPLGRVVSRLDLGLRGVVDGPLPERLAEKPFFARNNFLLLTIFIGLCGMIAAIGPFYQRWKQRISAKVDISYR